MKAFRAIKDDMRHACRAVTQPVPGGTHAPMQTQRPRRYAALECGEPDGSAIEPWMEAAFHGLTHASETGDPFALVSCTMNGEPATIIALARQQGRQTHIMPLFLACQPWMKFGAPAGEESDDEDTS
jgi:hypothetical protein